MMTLGTSGSSGKAAAKAAAAFALAREDSQKSGVKGWGKEETCRRHFSEQISLDSRITVYLRCGLLSPEDERKGLEV